MVFRTTAWIAVLFFGGLSSVHAQVSLNPGIGQGGDQFAVCAFGAGGDLNIAEEDDCEGGTTLFPTTGLTVGPSGTQTFLDAGNGHATFGGGATFNSGSTFNADVTVVNGADLHVGPVGPNRTTLFDNGNVDIGGNLDVNGSATASGLFIAGSGQTINMGDNRIQRVADPTDDLDATNKRYVDGRITEVSNVAADQQNQIDDVVIVNNSQQIQIDQNSSDIMSLQSDVRDLRERDDELAEGIALSLALDAPLLREGQTFAMRGGWGNFEGSNAAGFTAAGALSQNVVVDAGIGYGASQGTVAGKAGMTLGW